MHKYRKIIGVLISQSDGEFQQKLICGIEKQAFELDYDVLVFSPFVSEGGTDGWRTGEENIYNMVNFDLLDAVIYAPDSIKFAASRDRLTERLRKHYRRPVVTVEYDIDDIPNIYSDDEASVKELIAHLVNVHKITDIAFVTGPENHPHSKRRLEGYYEALVENGLTIDRSRVFYGDFWYTCGEDIVQRLCSDSRPLPQAVACASDVMAIGICEALKKRGLRVPEDIVVTGYDSVPTGQNYYPGITSAVLPAELTGENAVRKLHSLITGTRYNSAEYSPKLIIGQSCGCGINIGETKHMDSLEWQNSIFLTDFSSSRNFALEELCAENDLNSYLGKVGWYTCQLRKFERFCLCFCEDWDGQTDNDRGTTFLKDGYTTKMQLVIDRRSNDNAQDIIRRFNLAEMLPAIYEKRLYPAAWFFTPVHFEERCFGYAAVSYGTELTVYNEQYRMMMRNINCSLESLRRQRKLKIMSRRMRENELFDPMTEIYGRCGFNLYADEIFRSAGQNGKKMLAIVGGINGLREINRSYGHSGGDNAIKAAAEAFREVSGTDKICFRIDGDIFLLLDTGEYTSEQADKLKRQLNDALERIVQKRALEYPLRLTYGVYNGSVNGFTNIEQPIGIAYDEMRSAKKKRLTVSI